MKIIDEAMDQCLLCIGYDFAEDSPSQREVARREFGPGVGQKEWWRYHNAHLGLRTLVAYSGRRPVGHIEFIPIEHAPRPVTGDSLSFVVCLYVAAASRGKGIGKALLKAAEAEVTGHAAGLAVMAAWTGPSVPARFFTHMGFHPVATRGDQCLLNLPFDRAYSPRFLPVRYQPRLSARRVTIDFFHCPQCPYSAFVLDRLRHRARQTDRLDLNVIPVSDRSSIEAWGLADTILLNGRPIATTPFDLSAVLLRIEAALLARGDSSIRLN
jgi:GNAT superfamily N-acetyltransferase